LNTSDQLQDKAGLRAPVTSFSQLLGQKRAKFFFQNVLYRQKIAHAYLFTGIPGIGKTTLAKIFSMALNCESPNGVDACGHCRSCRQMIRGNYPDFITVQPEGQIIKIDQIRKIKQSFNFAPLSGKYRVCLIQQANKMIEEASNAFLKILEEPPYGNILILCAREPLDLLPTIVSRCQRVPFQPLAVEKIKDWLIKNNGLDEQKALLLARISEGSLGRAIKNWESDFFSRRQVWLSKLKNVFKASPGMFLSMESKKTAIDKTDNKETISNMMEVWETWYRDLLLIRAKVPNHYIINSDFLSKLKKIAGNFTINNILKSLTILNQAQIELQGMRNTTLVLEHTIMNLSRLVG